MRLIPSLAVAAMAIVIPLLAALPANALKIALPANVSTTQQAMNAEVIVVGKVTEIEKEASKATAAPGVADKVDFQVAVIKINESLLGAKGLTTIRVGFLPAANGGVLPPNAQPQFRPIRPIGRPQVVLTEGQEGCFFLSKHHDGDFYVMQRFGQPLDKTATDFEKQLDAVKKLLKAFDDPKSALKAAEASDRQFAACMLVQKYRRYPQVTTPNAKVVQESIDAEESKLILLALSEMEWGKVDPTGVALQNAFSQFALQPKDGWTQPKFQQGQDFNKIMGAAVAKWLKENADKYRIQRQVAK